MRYNGKEIGGKELGPVSFSFKGDEELARLLVGQGRAVLGQLKQNMQFNKNTYGIERKVLKGGVVIEAHSIKGPLADQDKVMIYVPPKPPPKGKPGNKIVGFTLWLKKHDAQGIPYQGWIFTGKEQSVNYWVSEPYMTTGNAVRLFTGEGYFSYMDQWADTAIHNDASKIGTDGNGNPYTQYTDLPFGSALGNVWTVLNARGEEVNSISKTAYGLFCHTNSAFNTLTESFRFEDGYLGRIECRLGKAVSATPVINTTLLDHGWIELPMSVGNNLEVPEVNAFIPGEYLVGTGTAASLNYPSFYPVDHGGIKFVFYLDDGRTREVDTDFEIHYGLGRSFFVIDTKLGVLKHYDTEQTSNPFYVSTGGTYGNYVSSPIAQREVPDTLTPYRVYQITDFPES